MRSYTVGALLLLSISRITAQVYNYDPVRYSNFETNPAYLASTSTFFLFNHLHLGSAYNNQKLSGDAIRASFYSASHFSGIGIVAGYMQTQPGASYAYAGIGGAYRIVLFNRVHTRLGLICKTLQTTAPVGHFDNYSFTSDAGKPYQKPVLNSNLSISFSSAKDRIYLAFACLNLPVATSKSTPFPFYFAVYAGDLAKLLHNTLWEINYAALFKQPMITAGFSTSHYLTFVYKGFIINRNTSLIAAIRIGLAESRYLQGNPGLGIHHRTNKRRFLIGQLGCDLGLGSQLKPVYKPSFQINLSYIFS